MFTLRKALIKFGRRFLTFGYSKKLDKLEMLKTKAERDRNWGLEAYMKSQKTLIALQSESESLQQQLTKQSRLLNSLETEINLVQKQLAKSASLNVTFEKLRKIWLDYQIKMLDSNSYGAGQVYELWEERKHDAVCHFISHYQKELTEDEIKQIKKETDYCEDFEPYTEIDEETGQVINAYEMAHKLTYGLYPWEEA